MFKLHFSIEHKKINDMNTKEIKKKVEELVPAQQQLFSIMKTNRVKIEETIYDICEAYGENGEVDLADEDECYDLTVAYDGGNHPEYASNLCSTAYSVKSDMCKDFATGEERKSFTLQIEDCPCYDAERLDFGDVDNLFDFLVAKYEIMED